MQSIGQILQRRMAIRPYPCGPRKGTGRLSKLVVVREIEVVTSAKRCSGVRQMVWRPLVVRIQKRDIAGSFWRSVEPRVARCAGAGVGLPDEGDAIGREHGR